MNFRQVDAFRALMLTRTTTKAAQLLGISQSGISRLTTDLERSTGLTLFSRVRGRLDPTVQAYALYEEVERRYAGLDKLREFALGLRNPAHAVIRVGSVLSFGLGYFARVLASFRQRQPSVHVALVTGSSQLIRDQVVAGQLSLGIVTDTIDVTHTDAVSFARLDAICALPADHALARKRVIRLADLRGHRIIYYEPSELVRWGMDSLFVEGGLDQQVVATVRYSVNVGALVKERVGIGLLHPVAAYDFLDSDLVFRRFEPATTFHTLKITRHGPTPGQPFEELGQVMDQVLGDIVAKVQARMKASA